MLGISILGLSSRRGLSRLCWPVFYRVLVIKKLFGSINSFVKWPGLELVLF